MPIQNPSGMRGFNTPRPGTKTLNPTTGATVTRPGTDPHARPRPAAPPAPAPTTQPPPWTPQSAPGFAEEWWKKNGSRFDTPTSGSGYWQGVSGWFNGPGQGENTLNDVSEQLRGPGQFEDWWGRNSSRLDGTGALEGQQGRISNEIDGARSMNQFWGLAAPQLGNAGYSEHLAMGYVPEDSYSEQFLTGGGAIQGLDALYDRMSQTGGRRLDNAAAARSGFNSGAALRNLQELEADLSANYVKDYQSAANQADVHKMARFGEARNLMSSADSSLRGRLSTGFEGASASDRSTLDRASALQKLFEGVGNETRSNLTTAGNLAGMAQDKYEGRLKARGDAAGSAQDKALARLLGGGSLASDADAGTLAKLLGGSTASRSAQSAQEGRETGVMDKLLGVAGAKAGAHERATAAANEEQARLKLGAIQMEIDSGAISEAEGKAKAAALLQAMGLPLSMLPALMNKGK